RRAWGLVSPVHRRSVAARSRGRTARVGSGRQKYLWRLLSTRAKYAAERERNPDNGAPCTPEKLENHNHQPRKVPVTEIAEASASGSPALAQSQDVLRRSLVDVEQSHENS